MILEEPCGTVWDTLSPIALFVSAPDFVTDRNDLVAVAIQMDHTKGTTLFSCPFHCLSLYTWIKHTFLLRKICDQIMWLTIHMNQDQ